MVLQWQHQVSDVEASIGTLENGCKNVLETTLANGIGMSSRDLYASQTDSA
jgi:hypothetical protein